MKTTEEQLAEVLKTAACSLGELRQLVAAETGEERIGAMLDGLDDLEDALTDAWKLIEMEDCPLYYQSTDGQQDLLGYCESFMEPAEVNAIYKMNIFKYAQRAGDKPGNRTEDEIRKIIVYANRWRRYHEAQPKWSAKTAG